MKNVLKLRINYNIADDTFDYISNIKSDQIKKIVSEFLRTQLGKGEDLSEADKRDCYSIEIHLDLSYDCFSVSHNCGNKGLRDGILMEFIKSAKIEAKEE